MPRIWLWKKKYKFSIFISFYSIIFCFKQSKQFIQTIFFKQFLFANKNYLIKLFENCLQTIFIWVNCLKIVWNKNCLKQFFDICLQTIFVWVNCLKIVWNNFCLNQMFENCLQTIFKQLAQTIFVCKQNCLNNPKLFKQKIVCLLSPGSNKKKACNALFEKIIYF